MLEAPTRILWPIALAAAALAGACGGGGDDSADAPLVQVTTATSTSGAYDFALLAHGADLSRGTFTMEYTVRDATTGAPIDGLELAIVPWMPAMGHGTSVTPSVMPLGNGVYELDDVDLFMPGLWELRTTTSAAAASADKVAPSLQVD